MHPHYRMTGIGQPAVQLVLDAAREAEQVLEEEARRYPMHADIRHRRGLLRLARGEFDEAQREFEDALGIHPGYRAAHYGLRFTYLLQGVMPPQRSGSQHAPTLSDEAHWACVDTAYCQRLAGEDPLPALAKERPGVVVNLFDHYAAAFALRDGDHAVAGRHLEFCAAKSSVAREILTRHSIIPWSPEGNETAVLQLGGLLWTPLAADLYVYLGRIYAAHGLTDEAQLCFDRAFLVYPREASHALHRAEIAIAAGSEEESLALLTEAVAYDSDCVEAHIALGFEYAAQGFAQEAQSEFEEAARLAPHYADVRYNLGLLYVAAGRHEEALHQFRQAISRNRAYLPARHSLAALLCRMGRHEDGLREYERILRQGFQSADMLAQMGRAALALGRTDDALQYLERARFLNPDFVLTHYYLGQAYRRKGLRNKARSAWRHYLENATEWHPEAAMDEDERDAIELRDDEREARDSGSASSSPAA